MGVVVYSLACFVRVSNATINRRTLKQFQRYWEYEYYDVLCLVSKIEFGNGARTGSKQMRVPIVGYFVIQRCTRHRCPLGCGPHKVGSLSPPAAGTHTAEKMECRRYTISMTFLAGALRDLPLHCDPSQQQLRHSSLTVCQQLHQRISNIFSFGSCPIWECMSCKIRIGNPESNK